MSGGNPSKDHLSGRDRFDVMVVVLAVMSFALGYAGGSVLAGESISQQFWLVATVTAPGAALLALSQDESDDEK